MQPAVLLILAVASRVLAFIARTLVVPFFPFYMAQYALNYTEVGLLLSIYFVAYGIALVPVGVAADRFSPKALFALGWLVSGLGIAAVALAPNYSLLLLARIVSGIGVAMLYGPAYKLVSLAFAPHQRGKVVGTMEMGVGGGMLVALSLFPLLSDYVAFPLLFLATALCCLPAALAANGLSVPALIAQRVDVQAAGEATAGEAGEAFAAQPAENKAGASQPPAAAGGATILAETTFWLLISGTFLQLSVMNGMLGWLPTYYSEQLAFGAAVSGMIMGAVTATQVFASLPSGWISDRLGRRSPVIHGGSVLMLFAPLMYALLSDGMGLIPAILLGIVAGLGIGATVTANSALAAEIYGGKHAGLVASANSAAGQLGSALAGVLFGWIVDLTGSFTWAWWVCVALMGLRILALTFVREPRITA